MMKCPICGGTSEAKFGKRVLEKYNVQYFRCSACSFLFTESPYWTAEAYDHSRMGLRDTGMVERNFRIAKIIGRVICQVLDPRSRFLDYGAGTGLLVRMMRDRGFDFRYLDPYANNVFARGLEAPSGPIRAGDYELVTAIEVIEHSADPVAECEKMLQYADTVLFTTELQPSDEAELANWSYLHSESGQHVSLFSEQALAAMASHLGVAHTSPQADVHVFSRRKEIAHGAFNVLRTPGLVVRALHWTHRRLGDWLQLDPTQPSLVARDAAEAAWKQREGTDDAK